MHHTNIINLFCRNIKTKYYCLLYYFLFIKKWNDKHSNNLENLLLFMLHKFVACLEN